MPESQAAITSIKGLLRGITLNINSHLPFNFSSTQMKLITILAAVSLLRVTLASPLVARATCTDIGMNHFFFLFKKIGDVHVLIFFFFSFRGNIPQ